jgi:hypothetical protein
MRVGLRLAAAIYAATALRDTYVLPVGGAITAAITRSIPQRFQ